MKVSIVTVVYNNKDFVKDCIESVLSQNHPNIEHIVIDGGSTDGTQMQIEQFNDKLAYYISEKDNGMYNGLNKGINQATGEIVGILHSDDLFYESNTVKKIVDIFCSSNADLVYANGIYTDKDNVGVIKRIYNSKPFKKKYLKFGWIPLHTTIYVKKDVFKKYGLYNENYKIASDYEISLRWFQEPNLKKVFFDQRVVKMRLGGKSTSFNLQKMKSIEDLTIIRNFNLLGVITLISKIIRKIPQYISPIFNRKYA